MAAYRRVYDSHHLQADCKETGSAPESYARYSSMGLPLPFLPVRCSHFTLGNPKTHFSTLLFIYFTLFTLVQKKTSSNCCSAALAVYLLLFSASYYLHSPSTARLGHATGGAHVLIGHVDAYDSGLLRHGLNFSTTWCTM